MEKEKIFITGASGLLGHKLVEYALNCGLNVFSAYNTHQIFSGNPVKLNVSNKSEVERVISKIKPDIIVHCAALTNVDKCELEKDLAWKINVEGTRNIVESMDKNNTLMVYVSTDYVFDGQKGFYKEDDPPNPVNYYGYTKLKGEEIVKELCKSWCIVRPSVIFGSTPAKGKVNFVLWVLEKLQKKEEFNVIIDQFVSPTLNSNLAEMILEITKKSLTGIFHLAGDIRISRLDMVKTIAEVFKLDYSCIKPVKLSEISWIAKRPKDSSLDVSKAKKLLSKKPLNLVEALKRMKKETYFC